MDNFKKGVLIILTLQLVFIAYSTFLYSSSVNCNRYGCYERVTDINR